MDSSTTRKPEWAQHGFSVKHEDFRVLFVIWLAIGAVAAGQRGYFGGTPQDCAGAATIGVTAMAGLMPLIEFPQGCSSKVPTLWRF